MECHFLSVTPQKITSMVMLLFQQRASLQPYMSENYAVNNSKESVLLGSYCEYAVFFQVMGKLEK